MKTIWFIFINTLYIFGEIVPASALIYSEFVNGTEDDTINKKEKDDIKVGHWIYFGKMTELPDYEPDQKVEEGVYYNNRKEGTWARYFPNGKMQSEITFSKNRPDGDYLIYFENGHLHEQGVWKNNRNTKELKRFYQNGRIRQEFQFDKNGKRDGTQKYYFENGQLLLIGKTREGKEIGEFREFFSNGNLKALKVFNKPGIINPAKSMEFEPMIIETIAEEQEFWKHEKYSEAVRKDENANEAVSVFNGEGFHILYNKNRLISQKGFFESGRLKDGQRFIYDENGLLISIETYQFFRLVGEGVIE